MSNISIELTHRLLQLLHLQTQIFLLLAQESHMLRTLGQQRRLADLNIGSLRQGGYQCSEVVKSILDGASPLLLGTGDLDIIRCDSIGAGARGE